LLPPACAWLGWWAAHWYNSSSFSVATKAILLAAAAAINCGIFLRVPLYFSYREVERSHRELTAALASVRRIASPEDTIIVGFDSHFLGYRHAGYYLPEYLTIQFPEVLQASTTGVFAMHHKDTRIVSLLHVGSFRQFLLFPLPASDNEYREYMQHIRDRFPAGVLRISTQDGLDILTGPVSALPVLFPNAVVFGLDNRPATHLP
jgi:hypothetical protein